MLRFEFLRLVRLQLGVVLLDFRVVQLDFRVVQIGLRLGGQVLRGLGIQLEQRRVRVHVVAVVDEHPPVRLRHRLGGQP